jgi:pyruvyltransferase
MESNNFVRAFWYMSNNFGDNLNYYLIKKLSGKDPVYCDNREQEHFIVCGSILGDSNENTIVWGAGFGDSYQRLNPKAKVKSVRGWISAGMIEQEVEIVGDPAVLMRDLFPVVEVKQHKHAILPHWRDLEKVISMDLGIKIINPLQPVEDVIKEIASCEKILSTGLHGLILSDTYGIPNSWLDLGSDIGGDGIKFKDYYSTTYASGEEPIKKITWDGCEVHEYRHSLMDLLNSCPFYHE